MALGKTESLRGVYDYKIAKDIVKISAKNGSFKGGIK